MMITPKDLGFPKERRRVWIVAFPQSALKGVATESVDSMLLGFIRAAVGNRPVGLLPEHLIMPESQETIAQYLNECKALPPVTYADAVVAPPPKKMAKAETGPGPAWPTKHLKYCGMSVWASAGLPSLVVQERWPGLKAIRLRELDLLCSKFNVLHFPEEVRRTLQLESSIDRANTDLGAVIPNLRHYLTDRCRLVHPIETHLMQGLHWSATEWPIVCGQPRALLHDLSGNAFHGWVCALVWLAAMATIAQCEDLADAESDQQGQQDIMSMLWEAA